MTVRVARRDRSAAPLEAVVVVSMMPTSRIHGDAWRHIKLRKNQLDAKSY
jgi:hypothetical protein